MAHAKANSIMTIGLLGRDGGVLGTEVDVPLIMPSSRTARIQEMHILSTTVVDNGVVWHDTPFESNA